MMTNFSEGMSVGTSARRLSIWVNFEYELAVRLLNFIGRRIVLDTKVCVVVGCLGWIHLEQKKGVGRTEERVGILRRKSGFLIRFWSR